MRVTYSSQGQQPINIGGTAKGGAACVCKTSPNPATLRPPFLTVPTFATLPVLVSYNFTSTVRGLGAALGDVHPVA